MSWLSMFDEKLQESTLMLAGGGQEAEQLGHGPRQAAAVQAGDLDHHGSFAEVRAGVPGAGLLPRHPQLPVPGHAALPLQPEGQLATRW